MAQSAGAGSKGSKKFKGKTMDLNALLCDIPHVNWAEATESEHQREAADVTTIDIIKKTRIIQTRSQLPSAPKSARSGPGKVDLSLVPLDPPFSAYVGNIPYDTVENDLRLFFDGLDVESVKIITDRETGQMKGHGYVHFRDRESLIQGLHKDQEKIRDREVRVDLTQSNKSNNNKGGDGTMGEAVSSWRNARQPPPAPMQQEPRYPGQGQYQPRQQSIVHNYRQPPVDAPPPHYHQPYVEANYDMRAPRPMMQQGGYPMPPRGYQHDYGRPRHYGYDNGPPPPMGRQDSYGSYHQRRGYDNRGGGGGYEFNRRDNHMDHRHPPPAGYPADHYGRYPGGEYNAANYGAPRGRRDNYGPPPPRPSYEYDRADRNNYTQRHANNEEVRRAETNHRQEEHRVRPKLQLQPRTKKEGEEPDTPNEESKKASIIFGGAKPVDTTRRESDIEQKIEKQNQEIHKKVEEERFKQDESRPPRGEGRRQSERTYSQSSTGSGHAKGPRSPAIHASGGEIKLTPGAGQIRILARSRPSSESQPELEAKSSESVWDKRKQQSTDSAEPIPEEGEQGSDSRRGSADGKTNGAGDVRRGRGAPTKNRVFSNRGGNFGRPYNDGGRGGGVRDRGGRGGPRGSPRDRRGRGRGSGRPQPVAPRMQQNRRGSAGGSPDAPPVPKLPTYEEPKAPDFGDTNPFNLLNSDAEDVE